MWALARKSPIRLQPRFLSSHLRWLIGYMKKGRTATSPEAVSLLREMGIESLRLIEDLASSGTIDVEFQRNGALMVYLSKENLARHTEDLERIGGSQLHFKVLDPEECRRFEPGLSKDLAGGVFFEDDGWVNPMKLLEEMRRLIVESGALVISEEVDRVEVKDGEVKGLVLGDSRLLADEFVFAVGTSSSKLLGREVSIPIAPAWGHTITLAPGRVRIGRPVNFGDQRVALSQTSSGSMRISGFFELAPTDFRPSAERYEWLKRTASIMIPGIDELNVQELWSGMRPCTPDGLPVIGRISRLRNAILASGHCREGVTLAPAAGRIVATLVGSPRNESTVSTLLSPLRFGI